MHSIAVSLVGEEDVLGYLQDDPEPATPAAPLLWHLTEGWKQPAEVGPLVVHLAPDVQVVPQLYAARDTSGYEVLVHRFGEAGLTTLEGEAWTVPDLPRRQQRKRT